MPPSPSLPAIRPSKMVWPIAAVRLYPKKIPVGNKPCVELSNRNAATVLIQAGLRTLREPCDGPWTGDREREAHISLVLG